MCTKLFVNIPIKDGYMKPTHFFKYVEEVCNLASVNNVDIHHLFVNIR